MASLPEPSLYEVIESLPERACIDIARFGSDVPIVTPPFEAVSIEPPWV